MQLSAPRRSLPCVGGKSAEGFADGRKVPEPTGVGQPGRGVEVRGRRKLRYPMRAGTTYILTIITSLTFGAVAAAGPIPGDFSSTSPGGAVLDGRWSESYPGGSAGQIGNTIHAASWDGSALATQWRLADAAIDAAPTLVGGSLDANGTGTLTWHTTYSGGTLTLTDQGPWWNASDAGDHYDVSLTSYAQTTAFDYVEGVVVEVQTSLELAGTFDAYPTYELSFLVAQAERFGEGSAATYQRFLAGKAHYPSWIPADAPAGQWGDIGGIQMQISSNIPEPASLTLLWLGSAAMVIARKRRQRGRIGS